MHQTEAECEAPSRSDTIRGNYENKIRFFSPPEKVFEIFAHEKDENGELMMSYEDFLKTNSPYNQTVTFEGTEDYLKEHNPEFLKKVDVDNTGLISFTEYFFFTVLL